MRYWFLGSLMSDLNTRSHTPVLAQRVKRLCTVFHLPYRSGRSYQRAPERRTHKTPFTNCRLSAALRPGSPTFPGKTSAIRSHCASVSSYRLTPIRPSRINLESHESHRRANVNPECRLVL